MTITEKMDQESSIGLLNGRLDALSAPMLEEWLLEQLDAAKRKVVIDMGGLAYISSAGLRVVMAMARDMKRNGRDFAVCGLYGAVREVFMVSGFLEIIPVFNSVQDALDKQ